MEEAKPTRREHLVARLVAGGGLADHNGSRVHDPYEVPAELLARLTGKGTDPYTGDGAQDAVARIAAGRQWTFRGKKLLKVYEDRSSVAWLDPEGWTDCCVLVTSKRIVGLQSEFLDAVPSGEYAGVMTAMQHLSRGVRLGAAELWGVPPSDIGVTVTGSFGAMAGGVFSRPTFVLAPRCKGDNHFRAADAAMAMGSGKGDVRMLRRRLAMAEELVPRPVALAGAQAAAVIAYTTTPPYPGGARVRIAQFDTAGCLRCLDNRCSRSAGPQSKAPDDGPAMEGAKSLGALARVGAGHTQEWEVVFDQYDGSRRQYARGEAFRAKKHAVAALAAEEVHPTVDNPERMMGEHGVSVADLDAYRRGVMPEAPDSEGRPGMARTGMGWVGPWPSPRAPAMLMSLRNPQTMFDVVAEGQRHGYLLPGARLRLMRTVHHGKESVAPLRFQVVPCAHGPGAAEGGVHLRVPYLFQGEAGGGTLLEEHMAIPGAQAMALRVAACQGPNLPGDAPTPDDLAGSSGGLSVAGDLCQRWLYVTAESRPPANKSATVPVELSLQPFARVKDEEDGPAAAAAGAGRLGPEADPQVGLLVRQTFFLLPYCSVLHKTVVPIDPRSKMTALDLEVQVKDDSLASVAQSPKALAKSLKPASPVSRAASPIVLKPHRPVKTPEPPKSQVKPHKNVSLRFASPDPQGSLSSMMAAARKEAGPR
jgi:hypothetical protein